MDDLRAVLFYAHGVDVMTHGLRIVGIGLIIGLGLGCQSTDKLEPMPLPAQLPPPQYTAPQLGSPSPTSSTGANRPTVSQANPYPSVQKLETLPPGYAVNSPASIQVPDMKPAISENPANFQPGLPVAAPVSRSVPASIDMPQPPPNDLAESLTSGLDDTASMIRPPAMSELRMPE